jgi:hypothetical protein
MAAQPQCTKSDSYAIPNLRLTETIDGVVKGIVISDDVTHLYVQEVCGAEIKLIVEYSELAQAIAPHLQKECVRILVEGIWEPGRSGWLPQNGTCFARSFTPLKTTPLADILDAITAPAASGWHSLDNPIAEWKKLRGCE